MKGSIIYIIGAICTAFLTTGWLNAQFKAEYPEQSHREHLGAAVLMGAGFAIAWPIYLPAHFCLTGFAEHGWSITTK